MSMSVCLFVCLSVCLSHNSKTARPNFTKFSMHVARGRGSVFFRRHCDVLCVSGFTDDAMFSYHETNGRTGTACGGSGVVLTAGRARAAVLDLKSDYGLGNIWRPWGLRKMAAKYFEHTLPNQSEI